MGAVFLKLLNLSITASWLILAVILVRFLLKKAPKWISCVLWALVAIRLICPFSLESALSLIPSSETIPSNIEMMQKPAIDSGITAINEAVNPAISHSFAPDPMTSANPLQIIIPVLSIVWIVGMAAMLLYALISYIRLKKSVGASIPVRDNILACDEVKSPFILGIIKPLIYIPSSMEGETLNYVITHESAHIQRRDHWWKPFGFLLLAVYWFNPLCWLAYILLCRDIELACDEKVIQDMDKDSIAEYSQALLDCSFPRRRIAACPLAFGEVGVKERVKSVLNYKKPAFWIIIVAVVACIVVGVCFLTSPFSEKSLSGKLGVSMDMAVAENNHSSHSDGNFIATDYDVLRISKGKGKTTVYAWVYYAEYCFDGADVKMENASHIPTVVIFDTSADGSDSSTYDVIEYWIPRDGNYYAKDIREKFPMLLWGKAFDVSGASLQKEKCLQAARDYYGVGDPSNIMSNSSATKWFDALHGDEMVWDGMREINLDEFPGVTFRAYSERIEAVTDKEVIPLYTGMPIWSVFFCDLNGDGKLELCSSTSLGSGLVDNRFIIYDYANGASYERSDRGQYDYTLNLQNGKLIVEKRGCMQDELLASGELACRDNTYQIIWNFENETGAYTPINAGRSYTYNVAFANWTDNTKIYTGALNWKTIAISSVQHLPIYKFDTAAELDAFKAFYSDILTMNQGYDEVPSFEYITAAYDDSFFSKYSLMLAYVPSSSGSYRFGVSDVYCDSQSFSMYIEQLNAPETHTADMAGWFVVVEVDKADIANCTSFDAQLGKPLE